MPIISLRRYSTAALGLRASAQLNRIWSRYTGKERDAESGNDYFSARYYSSAMGRFLSPDRSKSPAAVPYAVLDDPQSLNLYAYVGNNPLTRFDPNGHKCVMHQDAPDENGHSSGGTINCDSDSEWQCLSAGTCLNQKRNPHTLSAAGLKYIECQETGTCNPNLTVYDASGKNI
jgi:RHS repeat-associated protein